MTRAAALPEGDDEADGAGPAGERPKRLFDGRRWLIVLLRALHLVAVVTLGLSLYAPPGVGGSGAAVAGAAVLATGAAMFALDLIAYPWHLREIAGLSMLVKLLLVLVLVLVAAEPLRHALYWLLIVWSAIFSHAPGAFRHRLIFPPPGR